MAAHERRILVAERNIQRRARPAALLRRRDQRRALAQHLAHRRAHLGMQDRGGVFEFAVFADRRRLAVALRLGAVDAERGHRLLREQFAEFLADRDQRARGPRHICRRTDFRSRRWPPRAGSAARPFCPISRWVSSTTVTILRMTALIGFPPVLELSTQACSAPSATWRGAARASRHLDGLRATTTIISPCNRNAAPSINPAASSFRAQAAPASSACVDLAAGQFADAAGHQARAEIAVGLQIMRRAADDGGMSGQIDGVGDDGGGGVGLRRGPRQHGDGVGNAERKAAAVAAAGRNPARGIVGMDDHGPQQAGRVRPVHQAHGKMFAIRARCSAMSPPLLT